MDTGPGLHPVIALVASAGGLDALTGILVRLPADLPASLIVIQHQDPRSDDLLAQVLQPRTDLVIRPAQDGQVLQPGVVHLPRPGSTCWLPPSGGCCSSPPARCPHRARARTYSCAAWPSRPGPTRSPSSCPGAATTEPPEPLRCTGAGGWSSPPPRRPARTRRCRRPPPGVITSPTTSWTPATSPLCW